MWPRLFIKDVGSTRIIRKGKIQQLNEDHSLAPQIDVMLEQGLIDEETARDHPDRNL